MLPIAVENVSVLSSLGRLAVIWLALCCGAGLPLFAQETARPPSAASPASPPHFDFPDNPGGLEHLAKQIIKAQKEGDTALASALAQGMVLPDPTNWYLQTFGPDIANDEGAKYTAGQKRVSDEILRFFFGAIQNHFTEVSAARFAESCDDNAGETAFGTLQLGLQPVPLYELRLKSGDRFLRLFALVYIDGGFRFVLAPRVPDHFPYRTRTAANSNAESNKPDPDQSEKKLRGRQRSGRKDRPEGPAGIPGNSSPRTSSRNGAAARDHCEGWLDLAASGLARILFPFQIFGQRCQ